MGRLLDKPHGNRRSWLSAADQLIPGRCIKVRLKNVLAQVFPEASCAHGRGRRWGTHDPSCVSKRSDRRRAERTFPPSASNVIRWSSTEVVTARDPGRDLLRPAGRNRLAGYGHTTSLHGRRSTTITVCGEFMVSGKHSTPPCESSSVSVRVAQRPPAPRSSTANR